MEHNWTNIYKEYNFIKNQDKTEITNFMINNIQNNNAYTYS